MIDNVLITPLKVIETTGGSVMHAMKKIDNGFDGFGEAYFSKIDFNSVKAWKRHKEMTLNIIVPVGKIQFVLFDDRAGSKKQFQEIIISKDNYLRLTVPPLIWMGFKGLDKIGSVLLNIANIVHDPDEVDVKDIKAIQYNWDS
jgi:dTDP-4-dehydrorhamnose 3,5-epimerase